MDLPKKRKNIKERISEGKIKTFVFLFNDLADRLIQNNNTQNIFDYVCSCTITHTCMCLYIREMNDSNDQEIRGRNHGLLVIIRHTTHEVV